MSATAAEAERWEIGDVVPLAFWRLGLADGLSPEAADEFGDEVISPIGVEHVELVGLITMPDEVLPNELYPAPAGDRVARHRPPLRLPASATGPVAVARRERGAQPAARLCGVLPLLLVVVRRRGRGVKPALEEFVRRVRPLNESLATIRTPPNGDRQPPSTS